jgi:hypothetical protein
MQLSHDESVCFASANGSRGASRYGIAVACFVERFQTASRGSHAQVIGTKNARDVTRGEVEEAVSPTRYSLTTAGQR